MLMMMRSDESYTPTTPSICNDPEVVFACLLDIDCPAECQGGTTDPTDPTDPVEVKMGQLNLSLASGTPANGTSIPSVGTVPFANITLAAGSNDVRVHAVTVRREGL